jgi:hypothetical protein
MKKMIKTAAISYKEGNKVGGMTSLCSTIENTRKVALPVSNECVKFIICRNCFWCASILSGGGSMLENCPNCSIGMLDIIPLYQSLA